MPEQKQTEAQLRRLLESQNALHDVLQIALTPTPLVALLQQALSLLLSVSWLAVQKKGALFLTEKGEDDLHLVAHSGLADAVVNGCSRVALDHCLCGKAAREKKILFAEGLDDRHDFHYHGMQPHGHYIVPILLEERVLGMLALYLPEGYVSAPEDEQFLHMFAQTLASVITRKQAEDERNNTLTQLHESQEKTHALLMSTGEGIYSVDLNGDCTFSNAACATRLGYATPETLLGKNMHDLIHHHRSDGSEYPARECRVFQAFRKGKETHVVDEVLWRADGTSFPAEYRSHPIRQDTHIVGAVVTFTDITEQQRHEEQRIKTHALLKEREEYLNAILENALDAIISIDPQGRVVDLNPAAETLFGYAREKMMGVEIADLIVPPELRDAHRAALAGHADDQKEPPMLKRRMDTTGLHADGKRMDLSVALTSVRHHGARRFTAFLHDITDRKQLINSLQETLEMAESANRLKSDFIANMSHEIRTPMNAIIGFTDLLLQDDQTPKVRDSLTKIKDASHSLMGIINDILDFSKMEAGKLTLDPEVFNLHDLFDRLANLFTQQITHKGLELILSVPPSYDRALFGDVRRLEQVLINLIGNAIKFTATGFIVVQVTLKAQGETQVSASFSVLDTGIGVQPDRLKHLFEPFTQADGSTTSHFGGTGLGLTICKNLVEMMGGEMGAESTPGKGCRFFFALPFEVREAVAKKAFVFPKHLQGMKVLLVEDSAITQKIIKDTLKAFSFDIHAVWSGEEALSALAEARRDKAPPRPQQMTLQAVGFSGPFLPHP